MWKHVPSSHPKVLKYIFIWLIGDGHLGFLRVSLCCLYCQEWMWMFEMNTWDCLQYSTLNIRLPQIVEISIYLNWRLAACSTSVPHWSSYIIQREPDYSLYSLGTSFQNAQKVSCVEYMKRIKPGLSQQSAIIHAVAADINQYKKRRQKAPSFLPSFLPALWNSISCYHNSWLYCN